MPVGRCTVAASSSSPPEEGGPLRNISPAFLTSARRISSTVAAVRRNNAAESDSGATFDAIAIARNQGFEAVCIAFFCRSSLGFGLDLLSFEGTTQQLWSWSFQLIQQLMNDSSFFKRSSQEICFVKSFRVQFPSNQAPSSATQPINASMATPFFPYGSLTNTWSMSSPFFPHLSLGSLHFVQTN